MRMDAELGDINMLLGKQEIKQASNGPQKI